MRQLHLLLAFVGVMAATASSAAASTPPTGHAATCARQPSIFAGLVQQSSRQRLVIEVIGTKGDPALVRYDGHRVTILLSRATHIWRWPGGGKIAPKDAVISLTRVCGVGQHQTLHALRVQATPPEPGAGG